MDLVEAKEEGVAAIIGVGMGIGSNRRILAFKKKMSAPAFHSGFA